MVNKGFYSCERNHYFFGKLMTVRDFENEQVYLNSKRKLGNRMLNGVGIVSGLDVILVDGRTVSIESGMAIDYEGREIVVSEPSVKRLNVIKGFEENRNNKYMYLCLEYKESLKESTFSVAGSGKDSGMSQEYNRVSEGYDLFLTSEEPNLLKLNELAFTKVPVYDENGLKIELQISKYVNTSSIMKVSLLFEKNNVLSPVKFNFTVSGELFKGVNNKEVLDIKYQETEVSSYSNFRKDYYMICDAVSEAISDIFIKKDSFKVTVGDTEYSIDGDIKSEITITEKSIKDLIIDDYYSRHFDEIIDVKKNQNIYLAKIYIVANQSAYVIEKIEKHPFRQYLINNNLLSTINDALESSSYTNFNYDLLKGTSKGKPEENINQELKVVDSSSVVTGVERINMGFYPKVGRPYYSYEFVHGLGAGKVGVVLAIENKANYLTNEENVMLFGNADVFDSDEFSMTSPLAKVGAIINAEKGTMRLGVKLLEKTNAQTIDVRWWAFKANDDDKSNKEVLKNDNVSVVITPNTTKVEPRGQVRFSAKVEGTPHQGVRWEVTEEGAGKIDGNGVYTAPMREGVYEVRAKSVEFEDKSDSAYVVVSAE